MNGDVAVLARRFARALEQLRASQDLQYVSARPLPEPAPPLVGAADDAVDPEPAAAHTSAASPPAPEPAAAARTSAASPPAPEPAAAARTSAAPSSAGAPAIGTSSGVEPRVAPAWSLEAPEPQPPVAAAPASAASPTTARAQAAPPPPRAAASSPAAEAPSTERDEARRSLREQAQSWTPAKKLEYLRDHNVGDCQRCPLARTRNHIVFGVGNPHADVMFVGEAPGADEDRQGEPFVGRAGQLLNQWLSQLGLQRQDVYIANVLKCRPPGNRDPRPEEVDRCSPFLQAQIRAIEPKVIVALGRHAGMLLARREEMTLRAMRTSRLHYDAGASKADARTRVMIPLVVTYHPAYVLRQEGDGRSAPGQASATEMVMNDLRRALAIARGEP